MLSSLTDVLTKALEDLTLTPRDAAVVRLAQEYAQQLDAGADAIRMGPAYLAALGSLGMTPRARAAIAGKGDAARDGGDNPLDQLRARRAARAN